jgi:hypothetical protein
LEDADEDIAEYGDGSIILCTDGYSIYEDIDKKEGVDGLAVTHSDTYVIGDAHTNTCENRYSFLEYLVRVSQTSRWSRPEHKPRARCHRTASQAGGQQPIKGNSAYDADQKSPPSLAELRLSRQPHRWRPPTLTPARPGANPVRLLL